jgi:hypothetical protein
LTNRLSNRFVSRRLEGAELFLMGYIILKLKKPLQVFKEIKTLEEKKTRNIQNEKGKDL